MSNSLKIDGLSVSYGPIPALRNISIEVPTGGFVSVLGSNGAGKTTLVRTITGVLYLQKGKCTSGSIKFGDQEITRQNSRTIVRSGVAQVPEGRMLFPHLTVEENLRCGAASRRDASGINETISEVFDLFPQLAPLRQRQAGLLSGGEQQMVAVGRALMAKPSLLICDELSLGLAPLIVRDLFILLDRINKEGVAVLAIEQNARIALQHSQYAYALEVGEVVLEGPSAELRENQEVQDLYMGGGGDSREAYATIRREVGR